MAKPRLLVSMPTYDGQIHMEAAQALLSGPADPSRWDSISCVSSQSSLLGQGFNNILATALNMRDDGQADYLAMLHADIGAEPGWVDKLYELLHVHDLDYLATVVPIKEPIRQRTSTAIGTLENKWEVRRYITADHLGKMPDTFTSEDVCSDGEVLLVNTGCWITNLKAPFWDQFPGFNVESRVIRNDQGKRVSVVAPEDWELSRFMHANGIRYGATWAVKVKHFGTDGWVNYSVKDRADGMAPVAAEAMA